MQPNSNPKVSSARIRVWAKIAALLFLALYTLVYLTQPFSDLWNVILINLFLVAAASFTAVMATRIWAHYDPSDAPRRI